MLEFHDSNPRLPSQNVTVVRNSAARRRCNNPIFEGSNQPNEIETYEEFLDVVKEGAEDLRGFVFQEVDFSKHMSKEEFWKYKWAGANFLGCKVPVEDEELRKQGCVVFHNLPSLPFKPFRAFMYTQSEMENGSDELIYRYWKNSGNSAEDCMYFALHDFSMKDALYDYAEGKVMVSVMGGHGLQRGEREYGQCVMLGKRLAEEGFVVVTGGGPGAMEASNLGAWLYERTEEEVKEAVALMAAPSDITPQYLDVR